MFAANRYALFLGTGAKMVVWAALMFAAPIAQGNESVAQASSPPTITVKPASTARPAITHGRPLPTAAWDASRLAHLARPDTLILIRHAQAPGVGDPAGFDLNNCASQRNLDETGRAQAEALGEAWKAARIFPSRIFTSAWCRCVDTAIRLKMGPIAILAELNSFWEKQGEGDKQTARLKDFIYRLDPRGGPYVMVTHQVNISALAGNVVSSGAGVVVQLGRETGLSFEELPKK